MTKSFDVAHINEQGVDLIIVPLDGQFGTLTQQQQQAEIIRFQRSTAGAGLKGTVVPVWSDYSGKMSFIAPQNWHSFFKSVSMQYIMANVNRKIILS